MNDPLHGVTLKALLESLVERHGWPELAHRVPIRCFEVDPSVASSLKFLRKTPWARKKVEALYARDLAKAERNRKRNKRRAAKRAFSAGMPVERPETLAFVWPADTPAPSLELDSAIRLTRGVDRPAFDQVQQSIGFEVTDAIWGDIQLVGGAMVFARDDRGPIAVACAEVRDSGWVELAWVAVDPAHRGQRLARAVCSELVRHLLAEGHQRIFGSTNDDRVAALKTYLGMGFRPVNRPDKADRWAAVLR